MSKTRIVKGKYTKISGGNYNISAEGNITTTALLEVTEKGDTKGVYYGNFERLGSNVSDDFELDFSQKKDDIYSTVVPLGILDCNGKFENPFFAFNYSLYLGNVDSLSFEVSDEDGNKIYSITNLPETVITAKKHSKMIENINKNKPVFNSDKPVNIWDWKPTYNPFLIPVEDYTKIGTYIIYWDGFNNDDIYDSTNFNNKTLKVKITARKGGKVKSKEIEVKTSECKVDWVDVKIDKKNKKIDTTLRVNLKDGGEEGLKCITSGPNLFEPSMSDLTICPWDKIPKNVITRWDKEPIKQRTKKFEDLKKLAIQGLNYHWGRNENHFVAKDLKIVGDSYKFNMNAVVVEEKSIGELELIYNTNGNWMRSGNPGSIKDPLTLGGNIISRKAICYNVGYIYSLDWYEFYKKKNWRYREENNESIEFEETSAHEIGHEILKKYRGSIYSYGHKGTVNPVFQNENSNAKPYPKGNDEIDLMPYYTDWLDYKDRKRIIAAEKDVLGLIWLTKIIIG